MNAQQRRHLDEMKLVLESVHFPKRYITDQTAVCLMAMMDTKPGRPGLLPSKKTLHDGARIRNVLDFSRHDLQRPVAENTRESYRKQSLKPLLEAGIIFAHSTSVNDPNTYYELNSDFEAILREVDPYRKDMLIATWNESHSLLLEQLVEQTRRGQIVVVVNNAPLRLSPGQHNELIRSIVMTLVPSLAPGAEAVYVGDARQKMLFINRSLAKRLNLSLDEHEKLPDVIMYRAATNTLYVVEAVTSGGPVSESRKRELLHLLGRDRPFAYGLVMVTAFPDRTVFRRFVQDIAWDTLVWISQEGFGVVFFDRIERGRRQ